MLSHVIVHFLQCRLELSKNIILRFLFFLNKFYSTKDIPKQIIIGACVVRTFEGGRWGCSGLRDGGGSRGRVSPAAEQSGRCGATALRRRDLDIAYAKPMVLY